MVLEALVPLLECDTQSVNEDYSPSLGNGMKKNKNNNHWNHHKNRCCPCPSTDNLQAEELWTDGLICAFEFIHRSRNIPPAAAVQEVAKKKRFQGNQCGNSNTNNNGFHEEEPLLHVDDFDGSKDKEGMLPRSYWRPIGWARISELVQDVDSDAEWASQPQEFTDDESDVPVADVASPYWEKPVGPTWWCHLDAADPYVAAWFASSHWLHPAIRIALHDESRLISDRMKHLLYEVISKFERTYLSLSDSISGYTSVRDSLCN